jgi:hypothetical protein
MLTLVDNFLNYYFSFDQSKEEIITRNFSYVYTSIKHDH